MTIARTDARPDAMPAGAERTDFDEIVYLVSHDLRASLRAPNEVSQRIEDDLEKRGLPAGTETARRHRLDEPPRAPSRPDDVRLSRPVPRRPEAGSGSWGYLQRALRYTRGAADAHPGVAIDRDFGWDGLKIGTRGAFAPPDLSGLGSLVDGKPATATSSWAGLRRCGTSPTPRNRPSAIVQRRGVMHRDRTAPLGHRPCAAYNRPRTTREGHA